MREVYLDHSATTYVKKEVLNEMIPYFSSKFGNPSSLYKIGSDNKLVIMNVREKIANLLNVNSNNIYFTASGSEADNMILKGIARKYKEKGNHIITTCIEHSAIINSCKCLEREGFDVTYLKVNEEGIIDIEELKNSITEKTILISVMYVNNEIGSIQPLQEIGKIAKEHNIFFHSDCVQAIGIMDIDIKNFNLDAISVSAHKFYGPKGVGFAYINDNYEFLNLIDGGHQEFSKRAGTENVAGIVGIGKAFELAMLNRKNYYDKMKNLTNYMLKLLKQEKINFKVNGNIENKSPSILNINFKNMDCNKLLHKLNFKGIYASCGSACNSSEVKPSRILKAIGKTDKESFESIRFSFGYENTFSDIDYVVYSIKNILDKT